MVFHQGRRSLIVCILTTTVICLGLLYVITKSNVSIMKTITNHTLKLTHPSEQLCYRSDKTTFIRDQLTKLNTRNIDNKSAYINESDASKVIYISNNYLNLTEFIENTRTAFSSRRLLPNSHSIRTIFRDSPYKDMVKPSCDGLWMEFGVFRGKTLSQMANWKTKFCGNNSQPVYGFDTFSGLPTNWRPGFNRGMFTIRNGTRISVPSNVVLVKGLFIDTLPTHLRLMDREYQCKTPVSFVHIDCDIYDGARDVLFLLGSRFVPGTIIIFDELFNYPGYEKHEIKALFEFLSGSNLRLIPLGTSGDIDLKPARDRGGQSFGFVVNFEKI